MKKKKKIKKSRTKLNLLTVNYLYKSNTSYIKNKRKKYNYQGFHFASSLIKRKNFELNVLYKLIYPKVNRLLDIFYYVKYEVFVLEYKYYEHFYTKHKLFRYIYVLEKLFWLNIKAYLGKNLQKLIFTNHEIAIYSINDKYILTSIILKDIGLKLIKQNYSLFEVINPLIYSLEQNLDIEGFKISCAGRFARKQRATYYWVRKKVLSLNNFSKCIEYDKIAVTLRYGVCGIKIWLSKSDHLKNKKYLII